MRTEPEARWRGVVILAACGGLSYYLTTGEAAQGFALALLLGCGVTVLGLLFPPPPRGWRVRELYLLAVIVLVMPWIMMKIGYPGKYSRQRPAWNDLQARYPLRGPAPTDLDKGRDIDVSRVRSFWIRSYRFKRVSTSFSDSGAVLVHTFPLSMAFDPVQVPVMDIWRCRKDSSDPGKTTLSVHDIELEIKLPDDGGRILEWCARHGIPEKVR